METVALGPAGGGFDLPGRGVGTENGRTYRTPTRVAC